METSSVNLMLSGQSLSLTRCPDCGQEYMPVLVCGCPVTKPGVTHGTVNRAVAVPGLSGAINLCPECGAVVGSNPDCPTCKGAGYWEW